MSKVKEHRIKYDEISDSLSIIFESGVKAVTNILLGDYILIRRDRQHAKICTVEIMSYSALSQPTPLGMRSFALPELLKLEEQEREQICEVLLAAPVNQLLHLSVYSDADARSIPLISLAKQQAQQTA